VPRKRGEWLAVCTSAAPMAAVRKQPAVGASVATTPEGAARIHAVLRRVAADARPQARAVVLAAHPEDETLGAATLLSRLSDPWVIGVTDGAPRDPRFVPEGAPADTVAYARLRRREMRAALTLAGVGADRMLQLGVPDLAASEDLPKLVHRLALLFRGLKPQLVVTHAYEGGHPDHDAAAFAAQAAVERLGREEGWAPSVVEMLSYHQEGDELVADRFLAAPTDRFGVSLRLSPRERRLRRQMLECFASQSALLRRIGDRAFERFRPAPRYDFSRAPHPGPLHYELMGLGVTGRSWRRLAAAAADALAA
jgi:LmbE family N-acetylglucosaminyl deacetylase